ncbi:MAG: hypothetical protein E5299_01029 [Burkholderia gladioli]|nr:MAG: hypothetical protein E5299_01029 [Burkholderia gladioli]
MTFTRTGRGASPYQVKFQSNCLILPRKYARTYTRKVSRGHATVSGIGRPIIKALINRENVTIWINEAVFARIPDAIPTRGRPSIRRYA